MLKRKMKTQYVIGMLLWVSCLCIHQAYFYIFCYLKIKETKLHIQHKIQLLSIHRFIPFHVT